MPEVDFEEQEWLRKKEDDEVPENPKIVEIMLKKGIAKTSKQANYILGGVVVVVLIASLVVFAMGMSWI